MIQVAHAKEWICWKFVSFSCQLIKKIGKFYFISIDARVSSFQLSIDFIFQVFQCHKYNNDRWLLISRSNVGKTFIHVSSRKKTFQVVTLWSVETSHWHCCQCLILEVSFIYFFLGTSPLCGGLDGQLSQLLFFVL